ncbi:hypothetical protein KY363_06465 [Candidatus Woesearchaeota archaeon]|nr:hypothetical protein [Candidatus Woesearchaeota archaeon]
MDSHANKKVKLASLLGVFLISFVLSGTLTAGFFGIDDALSDALGRERGPPKNAWYDVAQWEIDFCMRYGGTSDVMESGVGIIAQDSSYITRNRIVTLQAEKDAYGPASSLNVTVYETAWFVQPFMADDDITYEVRLLGSRGESYLVDSGSSNYYNPGRGYAANSTDINFTKAELIFYNEEISEKLTVEIV